MNNTAIPKVTKFGLHGDHHHTHTLIGTNLKKTLIVVHKLGKQTSPPYINHYKAC